MRTTLSPRPTPILFALALVSAMILSFGLIAGFFGAGAPVFDSLAHLRAHVAAALAAVSLPLFLHRLQLAGLAALAAAGVGLFSVYSYIVPSGASAGAPPGSPRYSLLQMNLRFDAPDKAAALRLVGALAPDVVTLQEMTGDWKRAFEALRGRYPYQFYCAPAGEDDDAAILSRRPFAEGDEGLCVPAAGFAVKRIDFNGVVVTVASQHLPWPWPSRQWRELARLSATLANLPEPALIGGDFNAAPWSAALATYAALSRTRITPGIGPTWITAKLPPEIARFAGLPIDNVLASEGIRILDLGRPPATSSDHLPVLVTFTLPSPSAIEPTVRTVAR